MIVIRGRSLKENDDIETFSGLPKGLMFIFIFRNQIFPLNRKKKYKHESNSLKGCRHIYQKK